MQKLDTFLEGCGLLKLSKILENNGFDELELLLSVKREHLSSMEINPGDQDLLLSKIELYQNEKQKFQTVIEQASRSRVDPTDEESISEYIFTDRKTENQQQQQQQQLQLQTLKTQESVQGYYNPKRPDSRDSQVSTFIVSSDTCPRRPENKGNTLASSKEVRGGDQTGKWQPISDDKGLQTLHSMTIDKNDEKYERLVCWNCLKQFFKEKNSLSGKSSKTGSQQMQNSKNNRHYCSKECLSKCESSSCLKCSSTIKAGSKIFWFDGEKYCSRECQPGLHSIANNLKTFIDRNEHLKDADATLVVKLYELDKQSASIPMDQDSGSGEKQNNRISSGILKQKSTKGQEPKKKIVSFNSNTVFLDKSGLHSSQSSLRKKKKKYIEKFLCDTFNSEENQQDLPNECGLEVPRYDPGSQNLSQGMPMEMFNMTITSETVNKDVIFGNSGQNTKNEFFDEDPSPNPSTKRTKKKPPRRGKKLVAPLPPAAIQKILKSGNGDQLNIAYSKNRRGNSRGKASLDSSFGSQNRGRGVMRTGSQKRVNRGQLQNVRTGRGRISSRNTRIENKGPQNILRPNSSNTMDLEPKLQYSQDQNYDQNQTMGDLGADNVGDHIAERYASSYQRKYSAQGPRTQKTEVFRITEHLFQKEALLRNADPDDYFTEQVGKKVKDIKGWDFLQDDSDIAFVDSGPEIVNKNSDGDAIDE